MNKHVINLTTKFLSGSIDSLPAGKIHKRYTGIGATTLELNDTTRNSIIVVPTKALAATKSSTSTKATDYVFYLGSTYQNRPSDSFDKIVSAYSELKNGEKIKIMVVADTFASLFKINEEFLLKDFHLLIDEVDSFQSEASYRLILNDCIDIYKKFPAHQRSMISATLQKFLDEEIENEPYHEIVKTEHAPIEINLTCSKGIFQADLAYVITQMVSKNPQRKILIGYNSINGILKTIACLNPNFSCGILCGESSIDKIPPSMHSTLKNGILEHALTFITSAYFVGIDINDNADIIIAGDSDKDHTILTKSKITQIIGRVRGKDKNKAFDNIKVFVFNTNSNNSAKLNAFTDRNISKAKKLKKKLSQIIKDINKQRKLFPEKNITKTEDVLKVYHIKGVQILRKSIFNESQIDINWLSIDYLNQQQDAANKLYTYPNRAKNFFMNDIYLRGDNFITIKNVIPLESEIRYEHFKKFQKNQDLKRLTPFINRLESNILYGATDTCPKKFQPIISESRDLAEVIGDYESVKKLLSYYTSIYDVIGMKRFLTNLSYVKCWYVEPLNSELNSFIIDDSNIYSIEEARSKFNNLLSQIRSCIGSNKVAITTDRQLSLLISRLFNSSRIGRSKKYKFISQKTASDYCKNLDMKDYIDTI